MPISSLIEKRFEGIDDIILDVCRRLLRDVGDIIVCVEGFDGPSIRVVVRKKD